MMNYLNHLKSDKSNWINLTVYIIILFVFILVLSYVWKYATPFCTADDWRFIDLFLIPFKNNNFNFKYLWSEPVHPKPFTVLAFIVNAKYFHLQMHYLSRFGIFFQFFSFIIISFHLMKSLSSNASKKIVSFLTLFLFAILWFNFSNTVQYTWYLVAFDHIDFFLFFIVIGLTSNFYKVDKVIKPKIFYSLIIMNLFFLTFTFHQAIIGNITIFLISIFTIIIQKKYWKKLFPLLLISISTVLLYKLIFYFILPKSASIPINVLSNLQVLFNNFIKTIQSVGIAYLSSIFMIKDLMEIAFLNKLIGITSFIFTILFISNLILFFVKRIFQKSIFPGVLMLYSLVFISIVLLKRYNPSQERGIFCLSHPRYFTEYTIGIIGFFWNLILLLNDHRHKKQYWRKVSFFIFFFVTFGILINGIINYKQAIRKGNFFLNNRYPKAKAIMKSKDFNKYKNSNITKKASQSDIIFLEKNSLNAFYENFPNYQKD